MESQIANYTASLDATIALLTDLQTKLTAPVMVPIGLGGLAFTTATLHHTNAVLVDVGAGYFVEQSADDAIQVLGRRRARLAEALVHLGVLTGKRDELNAIDGIDELNEDGEKFVDIREDVVDPAGKSSRRSYRRLLHCERHFRISSFTTVLICYSYCGRRLFGRFRTENH